jgi:hypothetical protein
MVEYAIGMILLALAITGGVRYYGENVGKKYECAGERLDNMHGTFLKEGCTEPTATPTPVPTSTPTPKPPPTPTPIPPQFLCYGCHDVGANDPCPPGSVKATHYPTICLITILK